MEILNLIKGNETAIVTVGFMIAMTLYGHNRGFVRMLVSAASIVISLILVNLILPYAEDYVGASSFIQEQLAAWSAQLFESHAEAQFSELYRLVGLDQLAEQAGEALGGVLVKLLCFVVLFMVINLIMKLLARILNVVTEIPIIHGMNQLAGAFVGCAEAVFYIWIFMIVVSFTQSAVFSQTVLEQIGDNAFLLFLYHNNFIMQFLTGMLGIAL